MNSGRSSRALNSARSRAVRYTPDSIFDTSRSLTHLEPNLPKTKTPIVRAIGDAARNLVRLRDAWLNPPGTPLDDLKERTLTNSTTSASYGLKTRTKLWIAQSSPRMAGISSLKDEILGHLLQLNRKRATGQAPLPISDLPPKKAPGIERPQSEEPLIGAAPGKPNIKLPQKGTLWSP